MNIIIVGHVDHGKSTLIGRLLFDTRSLPKEKMLELKKISQQLGQETQLAYLTDQLKEERERRVTIDTTQIFFKTRKRDYVIIDAPGHVEYLKNMITGASLAQAAVLLLDVNEGIKEQTRRHAYIISLLGIDQVIAAFNKMDLVDYSKERYEGAKGALLSLFKELGLRPAYLVPIAAKTGANICRRFLRMSWYKGPTLLQALDALKAGQKAAKGPLRIPVQDVYNLDGERVILGRIASGRLRQGQRVTCLPGVQQTRVKSIRIFDRVKKQVGEGENIGIILEEALGIKRGDIIAQALTPPDTINNFKANIFWMSKEPLRVNQCITLRCATQEVPCLVSEIAKRIDSSTLEVIEQKSAQLNLNQAAIVTLKSQRPILLEKFSLIKELGRLILEREHHLVGAGIIS